MQIEGWELKKLEELCPVDAPITYGVLKPGEYVKDGIPLLQIKDLADGKILTGDLHLISDKLDNEYKRSRIIKNDILISLVGTVGRIAKYESSNPANIHRNIGRIRTNNHEYIFHFLHSEIASKIISGVSSGSSQSALNLSTLRAMEIPLPPLAEQKKIAEILSTWDKAIETVEKLVTNSQQHKKALMQQLLTGQKRLLDENGVKFGDEWEQPTLGEIANIYQPKTISQEMLSESGYPVYGANGIIGFYSDFNHKTEQIAVTCRGSTCGVVNWTKPKSWITGNAMVINVDSNLKTNKKFLYYVLSCSNLRYLISGSGQPQITGNIKNHRILLPSILEQEKIAQVLTLADREIDLYQQQLDKIKLEKKSLMQQLLTGQKRVNLGDEYE